MKGDKILIVDDDPLVQRSVQFMLQDYRVMGVSNAEEAVRILRRPHDIDAVLMDVRMSGMDGLEALVQIRKTNPSLIVIIMTGYGSQDLVVRALRSRADDFLEKPFDPQDLCRKLDTLLDGRDRSLKESADGDHGVIGRVRRFIEKNHDRPLSLKDASVVASLSTKYLSRIFKEKTGRTFTNYRLSLKLAAAKRYLEESDWDVNQIALKLGYENAESFMKMFKKLSGLTPTQYRRKAREKNRGRPIFS